MTRSATGAHILVVAQAFKGTLTAREVGTACEAAGRSLGVRTTVLRASDGGDGLLESLQFAFLRTSDATVSGPAGGPIRAQVGWIDRRTAVVETAGVCGLRVLGPARPDPGRMTSRGVGELVTRVVQAGAARVFVGLGGSATMDGGLGMARAWGWVPRGADGRCLPHGGEALPRLTGLVPGCAPEADVVGVADVRNPLLGDGGALVYAPQKGAGAEQARELALGLANLVAVLGGDASEVAAEVGAGAAGGLGFGLRVFGRGRLVEGTDWMLQRVGFDDALAGADAVLTGEGAFDATSRQGKLTGEVLRRAARTGVAAGLVAPTIADESPPGVIVETGGGRWTAADVERRAAAVMRRLVRLPPA